MFEKDELREILSTEMPQLNNSNIMWGKDLGLIVDRNMFVTQKSINKTTTNEFDLGETINRGMFKRNGKIVNNQNEKMENNLCKTVDESAIKLETALSKSSEEHCDLKTENDISTPPVINDEEYDKRKFEIIMTVRSTFHNGVQKTTTKIINKQKFNDKIAKKLKIKKFMRKERLKLLSQEI